MEGSHGCILPGGMVRRPVAVPLQHLAQDSCGSGHASFWFFMRQDMHHALLACARR